MATDMEPAKFKFISPKIQENGDGWGPRGVPEQFQSLPFQPFNKADKIGKVADWTGTIYTERRYGRDGRYAQQYSSGQIGTQYAYFHEEDDNFQLVDTAKTQKTAQQRANKIRQMQNQKKMMQKEREKRIQAGYIQPGGKNSRGREKDRQKQLKLSQKQYRQRQRYDQRGNAPVKSRQPSVQVKPEWEVLEEMDFPRLQKLNLPNIAEGQDVDSERYGSLEYYDRTYDRVTTRHDKPLKRIQRVYYRVTTTDDPVIQRLSRSDEFNVFGTDVLIATLMCSTRSIYSWDIVAYRVGNKLFFDKRPSSDLDFPTVSETAIEPPQDEGNSINSPKHLSLEAMFVNRNFSHQVLKAGEEKFSFDHPKIPFIEEGGEEPAESELVCIGYRYRKWDLGNGLVLLSRCEHDGVAVGPNGETQFLTIRAFNEWDSRYCGGIDWRSKIDVQRGAVLATELKNNSCKLAKWTTQALLAGSDYIKFGYVSRVHVKDSSKHVILSTQQFRPTEFANQINLNMDNSWGILRVIIDQCMKQPPGKYLLLKDPNKPVVRLYKLPQDTFEDEADEEEAEEDDEGNDDNAEDKY